MSIYTYQINKFLNDVTFAIDNENYSSAPKLAEELTSIMLSLFKNNLVDDDLDKETLEDFIYLFGGCEKLFKKIGEDGKEHFLKLIFNIESEHFKIINICKKFDLQLIHYILFLNGSFAKILEEVEKDECKHKVVLLMDSLSKNDFAGLLKLEEITKSIVLRKKYGEFETDEVLILNIFKMIQSFFRNDHLSFAKSLQLLQNLDISREKMKQFLGENKNNLIIEILSSNTETPNVLLLTDMLFFTKFSTKFNLNSKRIKLFRENFACSLLKLNEESPDVITIDKALELMKGIKTSKIKSESPEFNYKFSQLLSIVGYNITTFVVNQDIDGAIDALMKFSLFKYRLPIHDAYLIPIFKDKPLVILDSLYDLINVDMAEDVFNLDRTTLEDFRVGFLKKFEKTSGIQIFTDSYEIKTKDDFLKVKATLIDSFVSRNEAVFINCLIGMADYIFNCKDDEDFQIICESLDLGLNDIDKYFERSSIEDVVKELIVELKSFCWEYENNLLSKNEDKFEIKSKVVDYNEQKKNLAIEFIGRCCHKLNSDFEFEFDFVDLDLDESVLYTPDPFLCKEYDKYEFEIFILYDKTFEEIEEYVSFCRAGLENLYLNNDSVGFKNNLLKICEKVIDDKMDLARSLKSLSVLMNSRFDSIITKMADEDFEVSKEYVLSNKNSSKTLNQLIYLIKNKNLNAIAALVLNEGLVYENIEDDLKQFEFRKNLNLNLNLNLDVFDMTKILVEAVENNKIVDVRLIENHETYINYLMIDCSFDLKIEKLTGAISALYRYLKHAQLNLDDINSQRQSNFIHGNVGRMSFDHSCMSCLNIFAWLLINKNFNYLKSLGLSNQGFNNLYKKINAEIIKLEKIDEYLDNNSLSLLDLMFDKSVKIERDLVLLLDDGNVIDFVNHLYQLTEVYDVQDLVRILDMLQLFNIDPLVFSIDNHTSKHLLISAIIINLDMSGDEKHFSFKNECLLYLKENKVNLKSLKDNDLSLYEIKLKYKLIINQSFELMFNNLLYSEEPTIDDELVEIASNDINSFSEILIKKYQEIKSFEFAKIFNCDHLDEILNMLKSSNKIHVNYFVLMDLLNLYIIENISKDEITESFEIHLNLIRLAFFSKLKVPSWRNDDYMLHTSKPEVIVEVILNLIKNGMDLRSFVNLITGAGKSKEVLNAFSVLKDESAESKKIYCLLTKIWHDTSLAHRFDIAGIVKYDGFEYDLSGGIGNSITLDMISSFNSFVETKNFKILATDFCKFVTHNEKKLIDIPKVNNLIHENVNNIQLKYKKDEIEKRLNEDQIIAYPLSFKTEVDFHIVGNVIFKINKTIFLAHSDRSVRWVKKPGITIFKVNNPDELPLVLIDQLSSTIYSDTDIYKLEDLFAHFERLDLQEVFYIEKSLQFASNCSWASCSRPLVEMISFATYMQYFYSIHNPDIEFDLVSTFEKSFNISKIIDIAFSGFDKLRELELYKKNVTEPNLLLLTKIYTTSENRKNRAKCLEFIRANYDLKELEGFKNQASIEMMMYFNELFVSVYRKFSNDPIPNRDVLKICNDSSIKMFWAFKSFGDIKETYNVYNAAIKNIMDYIQTENGDVKYSKVILFSKAANGEPTSVVPSINVIEIEDSALLDENFSSTVSPLNKEFND